MNEYNKLIYPDLTNYLFRGNKPTEQYYLRDDDGFVVQVSIFDEKKKLDEKSHRLEQTVEIMRAFGF